MFKWQCFQTICLKLWRSMYITSLSDLTPTCYNISFVSAHDVFSIPRNFEVGHIVLRYGVIDINVVWRTSNFRGSTHFYVLYTRTPLLTTSKFRGCHFKAGINQRQESSPRSRTIELAIYHRTVSFQPHRNCRYTSDFRSVSCSKWNRTGGNPNRTPRIFGVDCIVTIQIISNAICKTSNFRGVS